MRGGLRATQQSPWHVLLSGLAEGDSTVSLTQGSRMHSEKWCSTGAFDFVNLEPEPSQTRTNCLSGGDSVTDVHMVGGLVASPSVGLGASSLMGYQALGGN